MSAFRRFDWNIPRQNPLYTWTIIHGVTTTHGLIPDNHMNKYFLAILFLPMLLAACVPFQPEQRDVDATRIAAAVTALAPTSTPIRPSLTPTNTSTPQPMLTPTEVLWENRVEIPYDETHWKVFDLPKYSRLDYPELGEIQFDSHGSGWISIGDGLLKVTGETLDFIEYLEFFGLEPLNKTTTVENLQKRKSVEYELPFHTYFPYTNIVNLVVDREDRVWVSLSGALSQFIVYGNDVMGWTPVKMPDHVNVITMDNSGGIWLVSHSQLHEYKISRFDGVSLTDMVTSPWMGKNTHIFSIVFDQDNHLWMDTTQGIYKLENGVWKVLVTPEEQNNLSQCYGEHIPEKRKLVLGSDGKIWGTRGGCLIRWEGTEWQIIQALPAYPGNLGAVAFDQDGRAWTGIGYLWNGRNYTFAFEEGFYSHDIAVAPDNSIWYTTQTRVLIYDNLAELP